MQSTACHRFFVTGLLLAGLGQHAVAAPMPDAGAPIGPSPVIDRTVFITEDANEGIGQLSYQALTDPNPIPVMPVNGMFALPFTVQTTGPTGGLACCAPPDDTGSDLLGFGTGPDNTTLITLSSEPPGSEKNIVADPGETETVVANNHADVPHTTTFKITSPPEPKNAPEPASLTILAVGLAALGMLRRRGTAHRRD